MRHITYPMLRMGRNRGVITASQSSNPPAAKWNTLLPSKVLF
jgi:hypothetical protein